ncbi:branched-chain amino acid ABC transporter permease [Nonomuraea diastatica]|uniref:Branched-chain amino acid ABC transporter permease n=2 Tax=Nonomuraea diastatica TaxID=1848329 RepID=A0A4R4X6H7_9ACTN|nr:branched-chain amino acid ABC transporter permease [Nonomuraea diastatica]
MEGRALSMSAADPPEAPPTPRQQLLAGARSTMPFLASAIPMGIAGGVLGLSSGLSEFATLGLAMAVNSGTAQFVGFALIADGASWPAIILTTLILGLRMLLYSTILIPYVKEVPQRWRIVLGFGLIDEVFFVAIDRLRNGRLTHHKHLFFLGASGLLYVTWMTCTVIGMSLGSAVPDVEKLGLDFPVIAMFVAMLAIGLTNWRVAAAIGSAGVTVMLAQGLPYNLGVVLAAIVGAVVGAGCELATRRNQPKASEQKENVA